MKTLYLECKMGAAGDMLMGALLELIPEREEFLSKINSLGLPGVAVNCGPAVRCGITGSHIHVTVGGMEESEHDYEHNHHHADEHGHTNSHGHRHDHADEHEHTDGHEHRHDHADEHEEHTHEDHADKHMHTSHDLEHDAHERTRHNQEHGHDHADEREHTHTCHSHEHSHDHDQDHDQDHGHSHERSPHEHEQAHEHEHVHHDSHVHVHFSFADIQSLIGTLPLSDKVKSDALAVYRLIGDAESVVHGEPIEQIHFHEVGSLDAVADVIGCCMLFELLGAESIVASPVCTGSGTVRCAHGILPVPAPATARLLLGIPCYSGKIESELCTPTGAALLRHFVTCFGGLPQMTVERIGYGMGTKDFPSANCVRAFWGEAVVKSDAHSGAAMETHTQGGATDEIYELCCNLDDMTPEAVGYACELLLREGALDVFTIPIQMKKSRPAVLLTCLCRPDEKENFSRLMLLHTTTLGVRFRRCERSVLTSEYIISETEYGKIRVKISEGYGIRKCKAEYEDVKAAAERYGVPFQTVADTATANIKG